MRMRFNKAEREAFTVGTSVEWRNGRHWHSGTISGPIALDPGQVIWHVPVTNTSKRGGVPAGDLILSSPTTVRIPAA